MPPPASPPLKPMAPDSASQTGGVQDALNRLTETVGFYGLVGIIVGLVALCGVGCGVAWCCLLRARRRRESRRFSAAWRRENDGRGRGRGSSGTTSYRNFQQEIGSSSAAQPDLDLDDVSEKPLPAATRPSFTVNTHHPYFSGRGTKVDFDSLFDGAEMVSLSTPQPPQMAGDAGTARPLPPAVPPPWEAYTNDEGDVYYYNTATQETAWHLPQSSAFV